MTGNVQPVSASGDLATKNSPIKILGWIGCGGVLLLGAASTCIIIGFCLYFSGDPNDNFVSHHLPAYITQGETFDFTLMITNTGNTEILIGDVDLKLLFNPSLMEGMLVLGSEPEMERFPWIADAITYRYNQMLAPGETRTLRFHLQAFKRGYFEGPVAVWVGTRACEVWPSITVRIQAEQQGTTD